MKLYITNSLISQGTKNFLNKHGRVIDVLQNQLLPPPEQYHADMQFTKIDDKTLICAPGSDDSDSKNRFREVGIRLISGTTPLHGTYPNNIPYNVLKAGERYFHNTKYTDPRVRAILAQKGYLLYHVRQGYAGCSSISIPYADGKILVLSSDPGVISTIDGLHLPELCTEYFTQTEEIVLSGYDHGLIGGGCGFDAELGLLVYGKTNRQLQELSVQYGFPIHFIYDGPLTDIGGILIMYPNL